MLTPLPSSKWEYDAAGHLLVRAGFGGSRAEIQDLADRGIQPSIEKLLNSVPTEPTPPSWVYPNRLKDLVDRIRSSTSPVETVTARQAFKQAHREQIEELVQWWTHLMTDSNAPLLENIPTFQLSPFHPRP